MSNMIAASQYLQEKMKTLLHWGKEIYSIKTYYVKHANMIATLQYLQEKLFIS